MSNHNCLKEEFFLGVDLGTGSLKMVLIDRSGNILTQVKSAYTTDSPQSGWAQQKPEDWSQAFRSAMQLLRKHTSIIPEQIRCISFCGAAHIPVLLDKNDQPVYPAILWNDCRSIKEVEELEKTLGDHLIRRTSNKPSCTWTLPQLLWLRNNVSESLNKTVSFLTAKDYLIFLLTGQRGCDSGSAAATLMYDFQVGEWAEELIELTGLPMSAFPPVFEPNHFIGTTNSESVQYGLIPEIPVVLGCLDSVAEMIAANALRENDYLIRLGTAGAVLNLRTDNGYSPGLLTYPFPSEGLSIKQAGTNSCGRSVDWIQEIFSATPEEMNIVSEINAGSEGLFFHPFLQGERAPYHNPALRGSFIGITVRHRREHFLRAVLEGISYSLRDCLESMTNGKKPFTSVPVVGGGVRYKNWLPILSNILGCSLISMPDQDSTLGAAILAKTTIETKKLSDSSKPKSFSSCRIQPDWKQTEIYNEYFEQYQQIAGCLNKIYEPKN
ncbi:MAG: hypothetical protein LBC02_03760 [Planctomycetaceae bacterium]|jgi:xylulokinase|nr:hypothetical protein [Planctomycetaceae bacterium]